MVVGGEGTKNITVMNHFKGLQGGDREKRIKKKNFRSAEACDLLTKKMFLS